MSSIRDPFFRESSVSLDEMAQLQNAEKGSLRRGWESGRIGTERNALGIDELAARSAGDTQRADSLRAQNEALAQAQARVAPRVQRVEDIGGVGDFGSWAAGAVGQGGASMVEPLAAATAIGGAGALMGLAPGAVGKVGRGLRNFGAPAAAYGINQRQLAGEFANDASQDAELMARTSPQDLYKTANAYGAVAGGLDTVLPAVLGRQLTGAGLRAGTKGMGPGAKTVLGMAGEGVTETTQNFGSQQVQEHLNPNRDGSGDLMDNVNAFAGGMMGSGPITAAGAMADAGYRRTGAAGEAVGSRAGEIYDLAQDTVQGLGQRAQDAYEGSALQSGVDKAVGAGKQKTGDLIDLVRGDDGQVSLERLADLGRQGKDKVTEGVTDLAERYKISREEQEMLGLVPPPEVVNDPDVTKYDDWFLRADESRTELIAERLDQMAENDPVAADLFDQLGVAPDAASQRAVLDKGAEHILNNNELEQLVSRAEQAASATGAMAMKAGSALGRGAVAAGKAAAGFGKAVFDGAMDARKKNEQSNDAPTGYDAWRERTGAKTAPLDGARANMFGDIMASSVAEMAERSRMAPEKAQAVQQFMRDAGYRIADLAQSWKATQGSKRPESAGLDLVLRETAGRMIAGLGADADRVLAEMQSLATPEAAPMFDRLRQSVVEGRTPQGRQQALDKRRDVANQLMMLLPEARRAEIMSSEASKGGLSRQWMLDSAEALYNGHQSPQFRKAFEEAFGKETVAKMMDFISPTAEANAPQYGTAKDGATYADEDGISEDGEFVGKGDVVGMEANDFEQRQGEKAVRKGSAPKLYGFYKTKDQSVRSSDDARDPFAPIEKKSEAEQERAADDAAESGKRAEASVTRPNMYNSSETGQRQLNEHIARMEKSVGPRYMVSARSARDVMDDLGYEPAKVLSVYRDYLRQDAAREGTPLVQRKYLREQANLADRAIIDEMAGLGAEKNVEQMSRTQLRAAEATQKRIAEYQAKNGAGKSAVANLGPGERAAVLKAAQDYLGSHHIAVAEMMTNRDPGQIELGELVSFGRTGNKTWDFAMKGRKAEQGPDPQIIDDANLITFQSDVMGKTGEDRSLHIPAHRLVGWVRSQRPYEDAESGDKGDASNSSKNEAYLKDLMEGITAIMDSGMVDPKLPTRMNAKGEWEAFTGSKTKAGKSPWNSPNGIPKNLQLETTTYGNMEFGRKERAKESREAEGLAPLDTIQRREPVAGPVNRLDPKKSRTREGNYHKAVLEEWKRDSELFVADDLAGIEPPERYVTHDEKKAPSVGTAGRARKTMYAMRPASVPVQRQRGGPKLDTAGNVESPSPYAGETKRALGTADPKTDKDDKTPLDFTRKQKPGEVPDEYADQRYRSSTNKATDGVGPEPKMSAMKLAPKRGAELMSALNDDFVTGMEKLESRMRTAGRAKHAEWVDGKPPKGEAALVGGAHYIAPLAHALTRTSVDRFDGDEHAYLVHRRAEVADFILKSPDLSVAQKIELTKAMAPKDSRAKIVLGSYATVLQKAAAEKANSSISAFDPDGIPKSIPFSGRTESVDVSKTPLRPTKRVDGRPTRQDLYEGPEVRDDEQTDMFRETYSRASRSLPEGATARTRGPGQRPPREAAPKTLVPGGKPTPLLKFLPKSAEPAPAPAASGELARALDERLEYLNNPPPDYTTQKARDIAAWAERQIKRLDGAIKGVDETSERYEALSDARLSARLLVKKAASVLEGDESLADLGEPAAPGVASAGLPKGSASQRGGQEGKTSGTYDNPIVGDLWAQEGVKVVSTNLGGVHGRGLAAQARDKGIIGPQHKDFDSSPLNRGVVTLAVKGWAPETAKVQGRAFSEQVSGKNIDLLKSELRKLIKYARANTNTKIFLPYVGLGFGEGDASVIGPILRFVANEPNIFMVAKDQKTIAQYAGSFVPGVRQDATARGGQRGAEKRTAPAEFTNHSGGALGADSMFDEVGRSLGFTKHNHYYHGNKTPTGNVALTQSQVNEGIVHAKRAAAVLARPWNDKYASLLGRNWFQVKNASQVIAVAPLIEPGELNEKGYESRAKRTTVGGGTGYAVEMAIANNKEVHVFDTKSNRWFAWDGQGFVKSGVPALAKDYAGIGSRQDYGRMTPESVQAIRDVFEKALAPRLHSRLGPLTDKIVPNQGPNGDAIDAAVRAIIKTALAMRSMGVTRKDVMDSRVIANDMATLTSLKLQGDPDVQRGIDKALMVIDQVFAQESDKGTEGDIAFALKGAGVRGVPLKSIMDMITASRLPESAKVVARAVKKVAGDVPVRTEALAPGTRGYFTPGENRIALSDRRDTGLLATTALHEGVHAATVNAVMANPGLHAALYRLMSHVVASDPRIAQAYGLSTTLEFLAEGLSNINLQRRLHKIPANAAVEKYLGRNVADAWSAFVELVRQALNLPQGSETALTQFLELSGMAMKGTAKRGATVSVETSNEFLNRRVVPIKEVQPYVDAIADSPYLEEGARNEVRAGLVEYASLGVAGMPHYLALATALVAKSMRSAASAYGGKMSASQLNEVLRNAASAMSGPSFRTPSQIGSDADWANTGARKLNSEVPGIEDLLTSEGVYLGEQDPIGDNKPLLSQFARDVMKYGDVVSFGQNMSMLYDSLDIYWTEGDRGAEVTQFLGYIKSVGAFLTTAAKLRDDNDQVVSRLSEGEQKLSSLLKEGTLGMTAAQRAVARAVSKVAGGTVVREGPGSPGEFDSRTDKIRINTVDARHTAATTLLHEGVHAATVKALNSDPELMGAVKTLMADVLAQQPGLAHEYAMANAHEFVAEGLSNTALQQQLMKLKPNAGVAKVLSGRTLWDAFMGLVRKALGVGAENSALTQLIELGSTAMRDQALAPKTGLWADTGARKLNAQASQIHNDLKRGGFAATHDSPIRHEGKFSWREHTGKGEGNAAFGAGAYLSTGDKIHAFYKKMFSSGVSDSVLQDALDEVRGELEAEDLKSLGAAGIREAVEEYLRESLDPVDSYTNEGIYRALRALKNTPDAALLGMKSPTYQVSVGIMQSQLLDWDKPVGKQSGLVRRALESIHKQIPLTSTEVRADVRGNITEYSEPLDTMHAEDVYKQLARKLGSQAKASERLQAAGILGHRYAAEGGKNDTHPNYVIYDDSKITTNYVHFSKQGGNARIASQAEMDEATAYVKKVLGPKIKVSFKELTGYSGEWLDAEQAIEISTTSAAGALGTAYHEALHGFFSKFVKSDPRVLDVMKSLAENDKIMGRVAALLAQHPAALQQLSSGEERLAYIYQFWASGQLTLPMGKPRTLLQKVRKFFRATLGMVRDSERAVALFEAFHAGQLAEPSAAGKVIAKTLAMGTNAMQLRRSVDGMSQWLASRVMPAETVLQESDSQAAKELGKDFFSSSAGGQSGQDAQGEGYLNARRHAAAQYSNKFAAIAKNLSDNDMKEVIAHLQAERDPADVVFAPHREAVEKTRALLQRFYRYMHDERGVELDHAGEKYFPRVWSTDALVGKQQEFTAMLLANYDAQLTAGAKDGVTKEDVAQRIWQALVQRQGVNDKLEAGREDGVLAPFFASKENRTLAWLQGEHIEPFLEKNLVATMTRYFSQGTRAAEYTMRFGADGKDLERRLVQVRNEIDESSLKRQMRGEFKTDKARVEWARRQFRDVSEAVGAMEGTLGKDISPNARKANSWMMVYQNVRLLPMALFSSVVDPLGMVARGATMKEAYDGFLRGMREVFGNWGDLMREEPKERQADEWEQLAEHVGAVDAAVFSNFVADQYSSVYMERGAKKINDTMFRLNGMEAWNRGMRVAGVKSAVKFIERHVSGPDIHSARWLDELGLNAKNVPLDSSGKLITSKTVLMNEKGISRAQAEREIEAVHIAINRWVEGAILTPNAAQRPAWSSDPHYAIFFHLKQFSYSFHQTILKRAVAEMNHGNLAPLGAFAWYIPVMIGSDIVKGLIQGGGELPGYMKAYDAGDWVLHGLDRSGTMGIGALGVGAVEDPYSLLGPAVEQITDAVAMPAEKSLIKALPANALYGNMLK